MLNAFVVEEVQIQRIPIRLPMSHTHRMVEVRTTMVVMITYLKMERIYPPRHTPQPRSISDHRLFLKKAPHLVAQTPTIMLAEGDKGCRYVSAFACVLSPYLVIVVIKMC